MKLFYKKFFLLSFIFLLFSGVTASNTGLIWNKNLDSAVQQAEKQSRPILINFTGSDWCKWCKKLQAEVFTQSEFISYAKNNLVLVEIDFPRHSKQDQATQEYNQYLAQQFRVQGFPTVVLINKDQQLAAYTGYQEGGAASYIKYLKSVLN